MNTTKSSDYQPSYSHETAPPPYELSPSLSPQSKNPWWNPLQLLNRPPQNATSPVPSSSQRSPRSPVRPEISQPEDELRLLAKYDTVFILDDSTSMRGAKWQEANRALQELVYKASAYDEDGIDLAFINCEDVYTNIREPDQVDKIFQKIRLRGSTPTGFRLGRLLTAYLSKLEEARKGGFDALQRIKPVNFIVITDGRPSDDPAEEIVRAARWLDDLRQPLSQVGIQFIQIGNGPSATEALNALDDELKYTYKIRDMVDTTPYQGRLSGAFLIKGLLGGINRRWDKEPNAHTQPAQMQSKVAGFLS